MSTPTEKLLSRLKEEFPLMFENRKNTKIVSWRLRQGELESGVWRWHVIDLDKHQILMGGPDTITQTLKSETLHLHRRRPEATLEIYADI